ncbi:MAG: WXG100 family type VII secretion target [Lachnospiraceae bacterium]|nr:WXG100 family type VII secretion target [Lachnospiraceae bacterium]
MTKIRLTPAELEAQSRELRALKEEYRALFDSGMKELSKVNENWSEKLSRNFSGKIVSAQRSCERIVSLLETGAAVASESARSYESVDSLLAKQMGSHAAAVAAGQVIAGMASTAGILQNITTEQTREQQLLDEVVKRTEDRLNKGCKKVRTGVAKLWDAAGTVTDWVVDLYNKKGVFYRLVEGGKATGKMLSSGVAIVGVWSANALTGGALTPLAVITTVYMTDSIVNNGADLYHCVMNNVDQVGKTKILKNGMINVLGEIGSWFGQEELGKQIAKGAYSFGKVLSIVGSLEGLSTYLTDIGGWWPALVKGVKLGKDIGKEFGDYLDDYIREYMPDLISIDLDTVDLNKCKNIYDLLKKLKKLGKLDDKWYEFMEALGGVIPG